MGLLSEEGEESSARRLVVGFDSLVSSTKEGEIWRGSSGAYEEVSIPKLVLRGWFEDRKATRGRESWLKERKGNE